jgi:hypothetical protein
MAARDEHAKPDFGFVRLFLDQRIKIVFEIGVHS